MADRLTITESQRFQILLTKAIDKELREQEKAEFEEFLRNYPQCRQEWQEYKKVKEVTDSMKFKDPPKEIWDSYWLNVYNRLERGIAWIILSVGFVILLTYGGFKAVEAIIADAQMELVVKVGILLTIAGVVVLFVSVIREKLFLFKRDPYREVKR